MEIYLAKAGGVHVRVYETALCHTVAVTARFNFMNRLVEGLGIELDLAYVQGAAQRLADRGYSSLLMLISR